MVLWLIPSLFDTRGWFGGRQFSHGGWGAGVGWFQDDSSTVRSLCMCTQSCLTLCNPMNCSPTGSSVYGIFQANTGMCCHFLLQGIFHTQDLNPSLSHLLHWQVDSLPLHHHLLGTLFLLLVQQLHFRSSSVGSQRLRTPGVEERARSNPGLGPGCASNNY